MRKFLPRCGDNPHTLHRRLEYKLQCSERQESEVLMNLSLTAFAKGYVLLFQQVKAADHWERVWAID